MLKPTETEKKEVISRALNLLGKLMKTQDGREQIVNSKEVMSRVLLYFLMDEHDYFKNALITLHSCCKVPGFREICLDKHKFTLKSFDPHVERAKSKYAKIVETEQWDEYVNICAVITALVGVFPELKDGFRDIIPTLIKVLADKLDLVRKNSAVLLAKLVEDNEENKKVMRAHHGGEVLQSVQA